VVSDLLADERYVRRAIELARQVPQLPFAALLVRQDTGEVVAEGWNRTAEGPLWHGEIDAIHRCTLRQPEIDWRRLTLYSTAEPCPMCQGAILWAGIARVVFGTSIRYLQSRGWWQIEISAEEVARRAPFRACTVVGGVLEAECNALFAVPPPQFTGQGVR
jgi:tRNA(Arg) A34 adenosine deaminase TadA